MQINTTTGFEKILDLNRTHLISSGMKAIDQNGEDWQEEVISFSSTEVVRTKPKAWRIYIDFQAPVKWINFTGK